MSNLIVTLFAIAFGIDAVTRFVLAMLHPTDEAEPLFYSARLLTFVLIIAGVVLKNRTGRN